MAATWAGPGLFRSHRVVAAGSTGEVDRYGGRKGRTFRATGFFRVEQDERWWLVSPEGNAFLSFGINHLYPDLWRQDYNREAWRKRLGLDDLEDNRASRIGWPRRLRNLGPNAPGKQAYVHTMRKHYRDRVQDFNATYGTGFDSFGALASATDWRPRTELSNGNETRDNVVFLQAVVDAYHRTARDAVRRHDPNHLFVGDKLNANTQACSMAMVIPIRNSGKHSESPPMNSTALPLAAVLTLLDKWPSERTR